MLSKKSQSQDKNCLIPPTGGTESHQIQRQQGAWGLGEANRESVLKGGRAPARRRVVVTVIQQRERSPTVHLRTVQVANFMLSIFYHHKKIRRKKSVFIVDNPENISKEKGKILSVSPPPPQKQGNTAQADL